MGFFFVQNFFSDITRDGIFIFFVAHFFLPEFNIRLYDKNSEMYVLSKGSLKCPSKIITQLCILKRHQL
jgi:hypothetical protein